MPGLSLGSSPERANSAPNTGRVAPNSGRDDYVIQSLNSSRSTSSLTQHWVDSGRRGGGKGSTFQFPSWIWHDDLERDFAEILNEVGPPKTIMRFLRDDQL